MVLSLRKVLAAWRDCRGFGFIEIAGVLVILGLLIGGILKGRELIEQAKLQKVASEMENYSAAFHAFEARFGALPGDCSKETHAFGDDVPGGNGDGIVDGGGLEPNSDAALFWEHLFAAQLIPKPSNKTTSGVAYPKSALGGGFTVRYNPDADMPGLWLVIGKENGKEGNGGLLTPQEAASLVRKLGGSEPNSGTVRAKDGADVPPGSCVENGKFGKISKRSCVVYYFLCP